MSKRIFKTGETLVIVAREGATDEERMQAFEAAREVHVGGVIVLPFTWQAMGADELRAHIDDLEAKRPVKAKRVAPKRLPCPGGGAMLKGQGDVHCPECKRLIGAKRGARGWYLAEHKMPVEAQP